MRRSSIRVDPRLNAFKEFMPMSVLYGIHAVAEALKGHPEKIERICIERNNKNPRIQEIVELARQNHIRISFEARAWLDRKTADSRHTELCEIASTGQLSAASSTHSIWSRGTGSVITSATSTPISKTSGHSSTQRPQAVQSKGSITTFIYTTSFESILRMSVDRDIIKLIYFSFLHFPRVFFTIEAIGFSLQPS